MDPMLAASAAQGAIGSLQAILGGISAKKANKELEQLDKNAPKYTANKGIMDFYGKALERYGVSPTASAMYKRQQQNISRGVAGAITGLQDRRSGQAGISSILRASSDAMLNAEVAAERQRDIAFGQLGQAAGMQAGEQRLEFDVNQMQPFERKYNRISQRAGAAAQTVNAGLQNLSGGLQGIAGSQMLNSAYGGGTNTYDAGGSGSGNGLTGLSDEWLNTNRRRRRGVYQ